MYKIIMLFMIIFKGGLIGAKEKKNIGKLSFPYKMAND